MNKKIQVGFAALAVAAFASVSAYGKNIESPAGAQEEEEEGAVGWTPVALGLVSPVQLPWGSARWDVFGLDIGAIWTDAPKMYGLGVSGIAMATRDDMCGLQVSGLCNWASKDVYGMRATLGANCSFGDVYGFDAGAFAYRGGEFWGWGTHFVGNFCETDVWGVDISGILNYTRTQSYGCMIAIGANLASTAYGCQIAGIFNYTKELHGAQIALVNYAAECPWGFQIGLINIIMDNSIKVLPIVNGYF